MTFQEFIDYIKKNYKSVNKYCKAHEQELEEAGISRATFYHLCTQTIKNPTRENLIAFSKVSTVSLEEVANVFVVGYRDARTGD